MKKLAILLSLIGTIALCGYAEEAAPPPASSSADVAPPSSQGRGLKMIWDYKKELEMSDGQEAGIKEAIQNFQKNVGDLRKKLEGTEGAIQEMIQKKGDMAAIKAKLQESADLQVELRMLDIETARKIDDILTPYQLGLWRKIQQRELAKQQSAPPAPSPKPAAKPKAKTKAKPKPKPKKKAQE